MAKNSQVHVSGRYLCNAALRSEVVIPLLMEELKHLVRFGPWVFAWSNASGQIINSATSPLRPETLVYFAEHFDNLARDVGFSVPDAMRTFPTVSNPWRTGRINPRMDETESFEKVWGPEGLYFNVTMAIRDADDAPLGLIQIFRAREDVDFDQADETALGAALPYVRRLLLREVARSGEVPMFQDGLTGVAVFLDGEEPRFISDRAFTLSTLAFNDRLAITPTGLQVVDPRAGLREMYQQVRRMHAKCADQEAPVVRVLSNERGSFWFEWEPSLRKGSWLWSVVIRHEIPARLRLLAVADVRALSDRQFEVCCGLLDGESLLEIAQRIGVKPATLKDHTREIYRKLGVEDRKGLLRKLMAA